MYKSDLAFCATYGQVPTKSQVYELMIPKGADSGYILQVGPGTQFSVAEISSCI